MRSLWLHKTMLVFARILRENPLPTNPFLVNTHMKSCLTFCYVLKVYLQKTPLCGHNDYRYGSEQCYRD